MAITDNQRSALQVMEFGYPKLWQEKAGGQQHDAVTASREATRIIGAILKVVYAEQGGMWPWKYWTKQAVCAQALYEADGNIESAIQVLSPSLGEIKALRFQKNRRNGAPRVDLSPSEQQAALRTQLQAVAVDVQKKLQAGDAQRPAEEPVTPQEPVHAPEPKPVVPTRPHPWIVFIREARVFFDSHAADGEKLDEWGMRQAEYGALMLNEGIPLAALKWAATMHLPKTAQRTLGVTPFDVTTFRPEERQEGMHAALPYMLALHRAGVPAAMIGPKGTGKTTLARQIAQIIFGDDPTKFTLIGMTSATSPSAFYGRPKIGGDGGVVESRWTRICKHGGVVLLDELDAGDENLLLIGQTALANRLFDNQQTGELIHLHPDSYFLAGMNTMGLGGTRAYNSRNKLDAATLDRWAMGRVFIGLDERVEDAIFYGSLNV